MSLGLGYSVRTWLSAGEAEPGQGSEHGAIWLYHSHTPSGQVWGADCREWVGWGADC